jgi:pimeloyl-ACP methyl ester carboxylesterase
MTASAPAIEFTDAVLRTGVRVRYAEAGSPGGEPVLLLHGYSDSWFSFSGIVAMLPQSFRLIVPDQRGHGDSERPHDGYTPGALARDALALLDSLGVGSAAVVGHSLGSFVAQKMAVLAPERVAKLVLEGSAAAPASEAVASLVSDVEALTDPVSLDFVREFQMSTIHRPVPASFMESAIAESRKLPARVWKAVLSGLLDVPFIVPAGSIRCPTTLVWGDRDAIFGRADQANLLELIPGARLRVLPDIGHAPHWEAPEEYAGLLLESLS